MGFSVKNMGSGFPFPSPGDLPDPGIKLRSPTFQADSLPFEPSMKPTQFVLRLANCMGGGREGHSHLNSTYNNL